MFYLITIQTHGQTMVNLNYKVLLYVIIIYYNKLLHSMQEKVSAQV